MPRVTGPLEGVKLGFTETRPAYLQWNVSPASIQLGIFLHKRRLAQRATDTRAALRPDPALGRRHVLGLSRLPPPPQLRRRRGRPRRHRNADAAARWWQTLQDEYGADRRGGAGVAESWGWGGLPQLHPPRKRPLFPKGGLVFFCALILLLFVCRQWGSNYSSQIKRRTLHFGYRAFNSDFWPQIQMPTVRSPPPSPSPVPRSSPLPCDPSSGWHG